MASLYGTDDTVQRKKPVLPGEPVDDPNAPQASIDPVRVPTVGSFDPVATTGTPKPPGGGDAPPMVNDANPWTTQPATIPPVTPPAGGDASIRQPPVTTTLSAPITGGPPVIPAGPGALPAAPGAIPPPISDPKIQTPFTPASSPTSSQGMDAWTGKPMTATNKDGSVIQLDSNGAPVGDVPLDYYGPSTHIYTENSGGDPRGFANGVSVFNTPEMQYDPKLLAAIQRAQVSGSVQQMKDVFASAGLSWEPGQPFPGGTPGPAPAGITPAEEQERAAHPERFGGVAPGIPDGSAPPAGPARNGGYYNANGEYVPPNTDPSKGTYLKDGTYYDGAGQAFSDINAAPNGIDLGTRQPIDASANAGALSANPGTGTGPAGQRSTPTGNPSTGVPSVGGGFTGPGYSGPGLSGSPAASSPGASSNLSTFGPGADLRDKQINPTPSAATSQFSNLQKTAADAVGKGANRGDISKGYLDAFDAQNSPGVRDATRAAIQRAAAVGKIGAGDTAVEAMNPMADYLTRRSAYATQLASDSASGDITDRLNNLDAANRTQGQSFNQDTTNADAQRTERGYQYGTSRDAINDSVQQWLLQQQAEQQDFNRGNTLAGVGYSNSPSNLLFGAGQQYGQNAGLDFQALAQYLSQMMGR